MESNSVPLSQACQKPVRIIDPAGVNGGGPVLISVRGWPAVVLISAPSTTRSSASSSTSLTHLTSRWSTNETPDTVAGDRLPRVKRPSLWWSARDSGECNTSRQREDTSALMATKELPSTARSLFSRMNGIRTRVPKDLEETVIKAATGEINATSLAKYLRRGFAQGTRRRRNFICSRIPKKRGGGRHPKRSSCRPRFAEDLTAETIAQPLRAHEI